MINGCSLLQQTAEFYNAIRQKFATSLDTNAAFVNMTWVLMKTPIPFSQKGLKYVRTVQELLGHSDVRTTMVCVRVSPGLSPCRHKRLPVFLLDIDSGFA